MTIFGIGTVVVDHAVLLDRFPEPNTKQNVVRHWKQIGGPVPIALSTAAFYGQRCALLGRWGNDDAGRFITAGLTDRGIDLTPSTSHDDWSSGFAQVWTEPNGARTIAYSRGEFPLPTEQDIAGDQIANRNILHLDGWAGQCAIAAARLMKQQGGTVVLDAGSVKPGLDELLPLVDILIASELFRKNRFGCSHVDAAQLLALGPESVLTTHGSAGAAWISTGSEHHQSGCPVAAVDTNGAGDIFSGAILHSLACGWPRPDALEFANAVAAYSCGHFGNSSLPTLVQIQELRDAT